MRCDRVTLSNKIFEVRFDGGARLWIEFDVLDFEPLELMGFGGESHKKLEFYYVT
jgi:hypothetical protein